MANQGESIHTCNMFGKQLDEWDIQEKFGFDYYIGYGSRHDLEHVKARFCCDCFDRILDRLVEECKTSPIVGEYEIGQPLSREEALEIRSKLINDINEQTGMKG